MVRQLLLFFIFCCAILGVTGQDSCLPLWPRIEFGAVYSDWASSQKMVIKFNTRSQCPKSYVIVSDSKGNIRKTFCESINIKGSLNMNSYQAFIQRCSLIEINFEEDISYIVYGSNSTTGTAVPFDTQPIQTNMLHPNSTREIKVIVLADWSELHQKIGIYKSVNETIDKLRVEQNVRGIIVNGDFAYDLDSNNGTNYEEFLNLVSRSGRYVPCFLIAGNHEHNSKDTLLFFLKTFEQYGAQDKQANSLNIGPFFIAAFDPYKNLYQPQEFVNLRSVDGDALEGFIQAMTNGTKTNKIIIPMSHYPLKCSASAKNCQQDTTLLKEYFDVMFENKIKFYIGAHYHTYERVYPYCRNGNFSTVPSPYYANKLGDCMVSILEGIAGNDDKIVETYEKIKPYTAALSFGKTGVGLMTVNPQSVKYQHFSSNNILTLEDQFEINYNSSQAIVSEQ